MLGFGMIRMLLPPFFLDYAPRAKKQRHPSEFMRIAFVVHVEALLKSYTVFIARLPFEKLYGFYPVRFNCATQETDLHSQKASCVYGTKEFLYYNPCMYDRQGSCFF